MKQTRLIMGMPVTVQIVGDTSTAEAAVKRIFDYFTTIDDRYSTYKPDSEISRINDGLPIEQWSNEMRHIFRLAERTRRQTDGFFDIRHRGQLDPSGLVKGWAIRQAAGQLRSGGLANFCIEAGGDFEVRGHNEQGRPWKIGIRSPFQHEAIVKTLAITGSGGIATSGTAVRGQHIYNPHAPREPITDIVSLSIIGPNCYEADRFATAAFAMGRAGINFIESLPDLEGYMIRADQTATFTSGFERFVFNSEKAHAAVH